MAEARRLDIVLDAIWKGADDIRQATNDIERAKDASGKAGGALESLGNIKSAIAGAGLGLVALKIKEIGQASLELASDAAETASLIDNSLGPAADGFRDKIEAIADATGRSKQVIYESSSGILAMAKNMGFAQTEAGNFAAEMSQAALDLESFFNGDPGQGFADLQSALSGSSEVMNKYGIDVKETTLKQMALAQGIIATAGDAIPRQERALLLLQAVQTQAADAMGDAERTADGYANTSRGLADALKELGAEFGQSIIEPATDANSTLTTLARSLTEVFAASREFHEGIAGDGSSVRSLDEIAAAADRLQSTMTAQQGLGGDFGKFFAGGKTTQEFRALTEEIAKSSNNMAEFAVNLQKAFGTTTASKLKDNFDLSSIFNQAQIEKSTRAMEDHLAAIEANKRAITEAVSAFEEAPPTFLELSRASRAAAEAYEYNASAAKNLFDAHMDKIATDTLAKAEADKAAEEASRAHAAAMERQVAEMERLNAASGDYFTSFAGEFDPAAVMLEAADAAGANARALAQVAVQQGILTQNEADLKVAAADRQLAYEAAAQVFAKTGDVDAYAAAVERANQAFDNFQGTAVEARNAQQGQIFAEEDPFFRIGEQAPVAETALQNVQTAADTAFQGVQTAIETTNAAFETGIGVIDSYIAKLSEIPAIIRTLVIAELEVAGQRVGGAGGGSISDAVAAAGVQ